jgi:hypothetical protein
MGNCNPRGCVSVSSSRRVQMTTPTDTPYCNRVTVEPGESCRGSGVTRVGAYPPDSPKFVEVDDA